MLMGLGLELPKHVVGHGWWLVGGEKGSKSKGNIPAPKEVIDRIVKYSGAPVDMATDALRYYLLRDISFTGDAEFGFTQLAVRYNGDLANKLGNLLNRSLNMLHQYCDGIVPDKAAATATSEIAALAKLAASGVAAGIADYNPGAALDAIAKFVADNNVAIDTAAPWKRAKEGDQVAIDNALYVALEALRVVSVLIAPFMPKAAVEIRCQLGIGDVEIHIADAATWGLLPAGTHTTTATPVFPRYDTNKAAADEKAAIEAEKAAAKAEAQSKPTTPKKDAMTEPIPTTETAGAPTATTPTSATPIPSAESNLISIADFAKVELRIAEIKTAERIEGAKKLLRLTVDAGDAEPRQIVAGIAEAYTVESLPGRKIVIVANLQPAVIRGVSSNGMLVAATDGDGKAILLQPERSDVEVGAKIR